MNFTFTHSVPSTMLAGAIALGVSSFGDFPRAAQAQVDLGATTPQPSAPQTAIPMPVLQPGAVILPPPNVDDLVLNVTPQAAGMVLEGAPVASPATAPILSPVAAPVAAPVTAPVAAPVRTAIRTLSPSPRSGISSPLANPQQAAASAQGSQIPYLIEFGQPLPGIVPPVRGNAQSLGAAIAPGITPRIAPGITPGVVPGVVPGAAPRSTELLPTTPPAIVLPVTPAPEESSLSSLEPLPNVQPLAVPATPLPPQSSSPELLIPAPRL